MKADPAVARLSAGLDRDEQLARAAIDQCSVDGAWSVRDFGYEGIAIGHEGQFDGSLTTPETDHIERQDPAHTLRRVEAIRKVLAIHEEAERDSVLSDRDAGFEAGLYAALECLASIYIDEPTGEQP